MFTEANKYLQFLPVLHFQLTRSFLFTSEVAFGTLSVSVLSLFVYLIRRLDLMSGTDEEKPSTKSKKILVGCTGSVASIKIPLLVQELQNLDDTVYAFNFIRFLSNDTL